MKQADLQQRCVAPMMGYTDADYCYLLQLMTCGIDVMAEMLPVQAVVHGQVHQPYLALKQWPIMQLGGHDPSLFATAAQRLVELGCQHLNINVGCPSPRVQKGRFGACLMFEPHVVAACVAAMKQYDVLVTVKCRLDVDEVNDDSLLHALIDATAEVGCDGWYVHARKAWLNGLNPKQNREIPPLQYPRVYALRQRYPRAFIGINGGVSSAAQVEKSLQHIDAVMIGRWALKPYAMLAELGDVLPHRLEVVAAYMQYLQQHQRPQSALRHLASLFLGCQGAAKWRRCLGQTCVRQAASMQKLLDLGQQLDPGYS